MKITGHEVNRRANKHDIYLGVQFPPESDVGKKAEVAPPNILVSLENGVLVDMKVIADGTGIDYQLKDNEEDVVIDYIKNNLTQRDFM